jgi:hypothetical protein
LFAIAVATLQAFLQGHLAGIVSVIDGNISRNGILSRETMPNLITTPQTGSIGGSIPPIDNIKLDRFTGVGHSLFMDGSDFILLKSLARTRP